MQNQQELQPRQQQLQASREQPTAQQKTINYRPPQRQTSYPVHGQDDCTNIEDILEISMTEGNKKTAQQQRNLSSFTNTEFNAEQNTSKEIPPSGERCLIKVHNLVFQCGSTNCKSGGSINSGSANSIIDMVSMIATSWKKQVESLSLTPMQAIVFYKQQYRQLFNVLSITLFNQLSVSCLEGPSDGLRKVSGTPAAKGQEDVVQNTCEPKQAPEVKRKRAVTQNNDCEYILFEKGDKFVYRRVESATKYAKRCKPVVSRYICIVPKSEGCREHTRNCIAKIRSFDTQFVSGNEINFAGDFTALHNEVCKRIEYVELDSFCNVAYVDVVHANNEVGKSSKSTDDKEAGDTNPPRPKKAKLERSKKPAKDDRGEAATRKQKVNYIPSVEDTIRSHVEENTDSDDSELEERTSLPEETAGAVESIRAYPSHIDDIESEFGYPPSPFLASDGNKE